jgi:hypothetical protein
MFETAGHLHETSESISAERASTRVTPRPALLRDVDEPLAARAASAIRAILGSRATLIGIVGVVLLTGLLVLLRALDVNTLLLGRDPTAASGVEPWIGSLSQFGLLMWGAACGMSLVGGVALRTSDPDSGRFLLWTAALTALLATDDAYLIHEAVAPENIGIPEPAMFLVLGGAVLAWLWSFHGQIAESDWPLLLLAAALLGASVAIDFVGGIPALLEDSTKYTSIAAFAAWCLGEAVRLLRVAASGRRRPPRPADATPRRAR